MDGADSLFDLTGRVALVTGGTRGLGGQMVEGFARAGADVVIASRDAGKCAEYAQEITELTGRQAFPFGVHMGHWAEIGELADAAYDRFGRVDILVNNAGSSPLYDSLTDISEELFDKVIGVNLKGPFRLPALGGSPNGAGAGGAVLQNNN